MGEIRLDYCCRLCLKEGFSLTNIFSQCSASGDTLYRILNFIYDIKIFENDGLPSQICSPCMWRMIEFDACKKNVRSAEAEIVRLLSQTRPHMSEVSNHGSVMVSEDNEMDGATEVGIESSHFHCDATIKDEIDVFEMENPIETDIKEQIPETVQHLDEADVHDLESAEIKADEVTVEEFEDNCNQQDFSQPLREVPDKVPVEEFEDNCSQQVFCQPLREEADKVPVVDFQDNCNEQVFCQPLRESTGSSDLTNCLSLETSEATVGNLFEGERSSIFSTQGISDNNRDTNKRKPENHLRCDVVPVKKSSSSQISESILNITKSGQSNLKASFIKKKSGFICDICKKSFKRKSNLVHHVRVHYEEKPFSCNICDKRFKQDNGRYQHELLHLRHKMSVGEIEKGTNKPLYSCDLCAKNFNSKVGLWRHSNVHSNKYKCNSCGRCFGDKGNLSAHLRCHTKEKPFKCEVCLKCFTRKGNRNSHLLIHSSERLFSCDICHKRFKTKRGKTVHALYHLRKE